VLARFALLACTLAVFLEKTVASQQASSKGKKNGAQLLQIGCCCVVDDWVLLFIIASFLIQKIFYII
jgi:hypothetical protein